MAPGKVMPVKEVLETHINLTLHCAELPKAGSVTWFWTDDNSN
jgi:hypothetical protein